MNHSNTARDNQRTKPNVPPPPVSEFLKPRRFFGFFSAFIGSWFLSRNYQSFFWGTPALIFVCAAALTTWQLAKPPDVTLAAAYERAAVKASRVESHDESDLMWERLMQLKPDDDRYRFVLAQSLSERGEIERAGPHLEKLTGDDGYPLARLWLVEQAREESPQIPLTGEQQIAQLRATIKEDPDNAEPHRLLAQIYIERQDYRVAEQHLMRAAETHPTLGLLLFELQTQLKRQDTTAARKYLQRAAEAFEEIVVEAPQEVEPRIFWSKALVYLGKTSEAEAVLTEALNSYDSPELRAATADFMIQRAQRLIAQSPLNAPTASRYVTRAAQIQPDAAALAGFFAVLGQLGTTFSKDDLAPVVEHQRVLLQQDPDNLRTRVLLAQLLSMQADYDRAIELLQSHQKDNSTVQLLLVRIHRAAGKPARADEIATAMLTELRTNAQAKPDQAEATALLADGLINTRRATEAIEVINGFAERSNLTLAGLSAPLKRLFVAASVLAFREQIAQEAVDQQLFGLIIRATETGQVSGDLLQLVSTLAYGNGPFKQQANELLAGILSAGNANGRIYASLGTQALAGGDHEAAVGHLKVALAQAPNNPVIQNNLAVALVRQSPDNAGPAMELCKQALAIMPRQPDVLSTRAEIHVARKRWPEARQDLEAILPERPRSATVRRLLVRVYTEMNELVLAAQHQKVLDEILAEQTTAQPSNG